MSGQTNSKLVEATDATFQSEVLESAIPVVVDFYSPTCGPCRMIKPFLDKLSDQYDGKVKVVTVNVADNQDVFFAMGGRSVPMVVTYHCGNELSRQAGARPYPEFRQMFQSLHERGMAEQCPTPGSQPADGEALTCKEESFARAVDAADQVFFAKAGPASDRFETETEPDNARFEMAKIDAANKLSAGDINQQEHDAIVQAAIQRFVTDTQAAKQRLMAVVTPAEAERTQAIEAARQLFSANAES
ncbi:MAG: hypothetical protein IT342_16620 [Candidatus Melainabacteria bacterium]|nr:hypothetical protein [Candidatus Melainabacteria bacterium]